MNWNWDLEHHTMSVKIGESEPQDNQKAPTPCECKHAYLELFESHFGFCQLLSELRLLLGVIQEEIEEDDNDDVEDESGEEYKGGKIIILLRITCVLKNLSLTLTCASNQVIDLILCFRIISKVQATKKPSSGRKRRSVVNLTSTQPSDDVLQTEHAHASQGQGKKWLCSTCQPSTII